MTRHQEERTQERRAKLCTPRRVPRTPNVCRALRSPHPRPQHTKPSKPRNPCTGKTNHRPRIQDVTQTRTGIRLPLKFVPACEKGTTMVRTPHQQKPKETENLLNRTHTHTHRDLDRSDSSSVMRGTRARECAHTHTKVHRTGILRPLDEPKKT